MYAYQQAQSSYDVKVTIENLVLPTSRRRIQATVLYDKVATWVKSASIYGLECESSYRKGLSLEIYLFPFFSKWKNMCHSKHVQKYIRKAYWSVPINVSWI